MAPDLCFAYFFSFACFALYVYFETYCFCFASERSQGGEVRPRVCFFLFSSPPCCFELARGKSRDTRARTSSSPESTRNTLIAHRTHSRFLACLFYERYEDSSTGGQQRRRRGTAGYRVRVNSGRHVEFQATMDRRFDYRHHRSLESDAPDDQMPPHDPENVP